ncbi:peptidoglycan-binding protein LysM, partial [Listeria monocytogenes]|nr:peptidoglycan-binding protein LysM [Listeria monocytogenes]
MTQNEFQRRRFNYMKSLKTVLLST